MKKSILSETNDAEPYSPIGAVERDTGIGRDTLRVWERRYGFPTPERNQKGERTYSPAQVRRLQLIRRLLDQGLRPGRVVPLDDRALSDLAETLPVAPPEGGDENSDRARLIALATSGNTAALTVALEQILARVGLRELVLQAFAPLICHVGQQWAAGRMQIFEEHLLTRQLTQFLDVAMTRVGRPEGAPRILLATLPGEQHGLGLLMVESLLWCGGAPTLNLGTEVPMDQIVAAVDRSGASTVALSFSSAYPRGPITAHLDELAGRLREGVTVWIGGEGVRRLRRLPPSVEKKPLDSL